MTYLIVSNDPVRLEQDAINYAKSYNPSDVFWIKRAPDKKEITVDVVTQMIDQASLASVSGKKLFLVFEADLMNTNAQNKLLKTIENTDDDTTVLFLCKSLTNILPTIKSRSVVRYHNATTENLTLKKLSAENPDSAQIYQSATNLINAANLNQAIGYLPILVKPENLTLALDALNKAVKASTLPEHKKLTIYKTLATITRNIGANCNPTNAFDLLLMTLF